MPLTATNWEVEFEFKIHGSGTLFGDGMAVWVTKSRAEEGPVFGIRDEFEGLGVFFDTIVVCTVTGSTHAGMIAGFAAAFLLQLRLALHQPVRRRGRRAASRARAVEVAP